MTDATRPDTAEQNRKIEGDFDSVNLSLTGLANLIGCSNPDGGVAELLQILAEKVDMIRDAVMPLLAARN